MNEENKQQAPKKKGGFFKWTGIGCFGIVALLILLGGCVALITPSGDDGTESSDDVAGSEETSVEETEEETTEEVTEEETEEVTEEPAEEENDVPSEWQAALDSAYTYADMMNMSRQGVYDQLVSSAGDDFPAEAAQYAYDNIEYDWNENALESAKTYRDTMSMSNDGIYDQLLFDEFTQEQAQYAVDNLE